MDLWVCLKMEAYIRMFTSQQFSDVFSGAFRHREK